MLVSSLVHCTAVLLFQVWEVQSLFPIPACPAFCSCEETSLVNCSSLGLPKAPLHIPAIATALDLSHNALHSLAPLASGHAYLRGLQHLWVGNNSLESLSMCSGIQGVVGTRTLTRRNPRCVSWAPDLQSLSADRNQLKCLPKGLGKMKSLKLLQLSHNRIAEIGPADLIGCTHLNELHLQYNLINTIHPDAFKDLQKLKVLDVSHNLLVTIPVPAYLSLRNLNTMVDIFGNRWGCDCRLKTIRKWLSFDSELGNPTWKVVCFSPSHHAGKDLLYLKESALTCPQPVYSTPGARKNVTVEEGMEFILSCSTANQDFLHTRWWTPLGRISDSQRFLHITNTTKRDAGLYVCISGYHKKHVSVFSLHVRKRTHDRRLRREAEIGLVDFNAEDNHNIQRNVPAVRTVQQSQFVLGVCLSVFITFIVAFVLGVILRPFLEKCYKQIRNKKKSTTSPQNSQISSTAQRPYVNEGYSEDQEQEVHEGPRVTFGGVTEIHEQGSVPYYVTVEGSPPGSDPNVAALHEKTDRVLVKNIAVHKEVPLRAENKEMSRTTSTESLNAESSKEMQFENIPDPEDTFELEERSISPAFFLSGEQQESQMSYKVNESVEQSVDFPTVSTYDEEDEIASIDQEAAKPGFITDPFPLKISESKEESVEELDPDLWNDSGESFSFTEDSPRSSSRLSHVTASGHSLFQKEMTVDEPSDRPSSCNSSISGETKGGPTEYTVNSEDDKESEMSYLENNNYAERKPSASEDDILTADQKTGTGTYLRQDTITLDPTDIRMTYIRGDSFDDEPFTEYKEYFPSSNINTAYEDEPTQYHVHPVYRTSLKNTSQVGEERSHTNSCNEKDEDDLGHHPRNLERKYESDWSHVGSSLDDSIFGMIDETLIPIPRIKQFLHFSPSHSYPPIHPPPYFTEEEIIPNKLIKTVSKQFSSEDNFFAQTAASLDGLPKVKQYIQFSPNGLQLSYGLTSAAPINKVAKPTVVSKTESLFDMINIFYEGQTVSLPAMPMVQRYVQFRQSAPQTTRENTPDVQGDSFFGQVPISFDKVPKVKQYIQFSPSESQLSTDSTPLESIHQLARPVVPKMESPSDTISIFCKGQNISLQTMPEVQRYVQFRQSEPQTVHEHTPDIHGGSLFEQMPISFDEVPKVKHFVQFSPLKPQLLNDSVHSESVNRLARPAVVAKTDLSADTNSIFYKGQNISLQTMPKVQRYVHFRQFKPQTAKERTPTIQGSILFEQIPISIDEVPKVKQFVQFSSSEAQLSTDTVPQYLSTPETVSKTESLSDTISIFYKGQTISLPAMPKIQKYVEFRQSEPQTVHEHTPDIQTNRFFGQIPILIDEVPKVKRHILFSQSTRTSLPYCHSKKKYLLNDKQITHEIKTPLVMSKPQNAGDIFFEQTGTYLDGVPKVKRYIQFTQYEVIPETHNLSPHFTLNKTMQEESTLVKRKKSPSNYGDSVVDEHNFFKQTGVFFDGIPKVRRRIQFTENPPQLPKSHPLSLLKQPVTPAPIFNAKSSQNKTNFFEVIHVSLENVPKVNKWLQFTQVVAKPSNQSIPSIYGKIHTSFDKVPKVKRYLQFIKSEPQLSAWSPPSSKITDAVTPAFLSKMKTTRSEIKGSPTIKGDDFFSQTVSAFNGLPKVKRYIQFTQAEPRLQPPLLHSLSNRTDKTIHASSKLKAKDLQSKHNILGPIDVSFEIPKVGRYIQFSQKSAQHALRSSHQETAIPVFTKPELWRSSSSLADSKSNTEETFFKKMDFSELPKVKRYIQFTGQHSTPKSSNNDGVTHDVAKKAELWGADSSRFEIKPPVTEDNFFGQLGTNLNSLPRVKKYIQFTQSEPHPSRQSQFSTEKMTKKQWKTINPLVYTDAKSSTKGTLFDGVFESFNNIPKVKKSILFTQSKAQDSNLEVQQNVTSQLVPKAESVRYSSVSDEAAPPKKEDNLLGQFGVFLDDVPKVKKYVQFSQSEASAPVQSFLNIKNQSPSPFFKTELVTPVSSRVDSSFEEKHRADTLFDKVPKIKTYLQFTKSELQPSAQSPLTSVATASVTPVFTTKVQTTKSANKGSPPIKQDDFFGQTVSSFNELPKVKRYIQFTQTEPCLQPPSLHSLSNRTDQTIHANSEMKHIASDDYIQPADGEQNILGPIGTSFEIPKVSRYIQFSQSQSQNPTKKISEKAPLFTHSEYQGKTAAENIFSNDAKPVFGSLDVSFNQLPKVRRNVQIAQPEPYLSTEEVFKLATKKNDFFGQTDGVPRLIRYRQHRKSEPDTQSLSPSNLSQKWKTMDVEFTESRMFKTNVTPEPAEDLSQMQEVPSALKLTTGTSRLHHRSPFLLNPDVYKQPAVEEVSIQTSSNSSSGDKKYVNTHDLRSRTALSTAESETPIESKLSSFSALSHESAVLQRKKPLVLDPVLQDLSQYITDKPADSSGKDDAREYLRDSSLARQRQERRRLLFQQKRRAMDGFSSTSESLPSQKSDQ